MAAKIAGLYVANGNSVRVSDEAGKVDQQVLRPVLYIFLRCQRGSVLADPSVNVIGKPLVELREVLRDDKPVAPHRPTIFDREGIRLVRPLFHRKTGEINGMTFDLDSIARHGNTLLGKDLDNMRASLRGWEELAGRVQQALGVPTKKQAELVVDTVVAALEATLLSNLGAGGFTLKLGNFGKFSVRHKAGIRRKVGFSGATILTKMRRKVKFISLGNLRRQERVD
jgi:nucleoid DNA-binding protein